MPKKQRRIPTEAELKIIRTASGLGQPVEEICVLCSVSKTIFDKQWAKRDDVRDARQRGEALASNKIRETLFRKATGGDIRALEFWAKCRLGFRTADRLELTGADGKPLHSKAAPAELSRDDIAKELASLRARLEEQYE